MVKGVGTYFFFLLYSMGFVIRPILTYYNEDFDVFIKLISGFFPSKAERVFIFVLLLFSTLQYHFGRNCSHKLHQISSKRLHLKHHLFRI